MKTSGAAKKASSIAARKIVASQIAAKPMYAAKNRESSIAAAAGQEPTTWLRALRLACPARASKDSAGAFPPARTNQAKRASAMLPSTLAGCRPG